MFWNIGVSGAKLGLEGLTLQVVLLRAVEEGADAGEVGRGVGVLNDDAIEVR